MAAVNNEFEGRSCLSSESLASKRQRVGDEASSRRRENEEEEMEIEKEKVEELDGWEDDRDRMYDSCSLVERRVESTCFDLDDEATERVRQHYISIFKSRGYDIPHPAPEGFEDVHLYTANLDDPEELKFMQKGAQHALALYNAQKKRNLKFVRVSHANHMFVATNHVPHGRAIYLTFVAEDENVSSPIVYQTRLRTDARFMREKILNVPSFRAKPN